MWAFFSSVQLAEFSIERSRGFNTAVRALSWQRCLSFLQKKNNEQRALQNLFLRMPGLLFKSSFSFCFFKYFFKRGRALATMCSLQQAFSKLFFFSFENIEEKKKKYSNFFFIFSMLCLNVDFFNINIFLAWLARLVCYSFFFKISALPKFLKKKTKKKYSIEPIFLEKPKRLRATLRILSVSVLANFARTLSGRAFSVFLDLAFNFKKSKPFKEKALTYAKIFKLLKKKKKLG